jgi:hypothetical protein
MWLLLPVAAAVGGAVWELILRPAVKSEVVQFTTNGKIIEVNSRALDGAGIAYDVFTDGTNSWIMVKPGDRTNAVQVVRLSAQAAGLWKPGA